MTDLQIIARRLGGDVVGRQILCPGPGHAPRDRSLAVRPNSNAPDGFIAHSFCGDDWRACRDHVKALLGISGDRPIRISADRPEIGKAEAADKLKRACDLWRSATPLPGTLGERYFAEQRGLNTGAVTLAHALRWHEGVRAVIALMTDPLTGKPSGVHRTFLNPDGTKRERMMLGKQGVVRLSADQDVTHGLGITEGIEDGLAVMLDGWRPVWAATSAGGIERLPVMAGVEALTIFADDDTPGMTAALACAETWTSAEREVRISHLKDAF